MRDHAQAMLVVRYLAFATTNEISSNCSRSQAAFPLRRFEASNGVRIRTLGYRASDTEREGNSDAPRFLRGSPTRAAVASFCTAP